MDDVKRLRELISEMWTDLHWYGHTLAGGVPMVGAEKLARRAVDHWYAHTLALVDKVKSNCIPEAQDAANKTLALKDEIQQLREGVIARDVRLRDICKAFHRDCDSCNHGDCPVRAYPLNGGFQK